MKAYFSCRLPGGRYFDYHHASKCGGQGAIDSTEVAAVGKMLQSRFPNTILSMSSVQAEFGHVEVCSRFHQSSSETS